MRGAKVAGRDSATDLVALRVDSASHTLRHARISRCASDHRASRQIGPAGRVSPASASSAPSVKDGAAGRARIDRVLRLDVGVYDGSQEARSSTPSGAVLGLNNSALARGDSVGTTAGRGGR